MSKKGFLIILLLVLALSMSGCSLFQKTKLTITNECSFDLTSVYWVSSGGTSFYFADSGNDLSGSVTKEVKPGTSPIYFRFIGHSTLYHTVDDVVVVKGDKVSFTFHDSTYVMVAGNVGTQQHLTIKELMD